MGITHVVRGSEYLSSAPKYNLLYGASAGAYQNIYTYPQSCATRSTSCQSGAGIRPTRILIAEGYLSEAIVNYVALLGWSPGGERELYT
jgi:glutamyl-tRNA synthetase